MAVVRFLWRALLCHVGIDFRQFGGSFRGYVVEGGCGCGEKGIVEGIKKMIEKKDTIDEIKSFSNATILEELKELLGE